MSRLLICCLSLALLVAISPAQANAESDVFDSHAFHPFTMTASPGGCGQPSSHTYLGRNFGNCDPIDLVFQGLNLEVAVALLQQAGWTRLGNGSNQWLHFDNENLPLLQNAQLYLWQSGGEADCPDTVRICRFHVRLWRVPGSNLVVGAAHYEGGGIFVHDLMQSWEYAEAKVCADVSIPNVIVCQPDAVLLPVQAEIQGSDAWRASAGFSGLNDSRASLIGPAH